MANAVDVGVTAFVVPGVTESGWPAVHSLCSSSTRCFAGYGLHPCYFDAHTDGCLLRLDQWLDAHAAVAVGECGLDYYLNEPETQPQQLALFDGQIDMAASRRLPLIVHARKAVDQVTQRLRRRDLSGGVIHSFSGSWQQACKLIDLGFHLGIGGAVTHDRAKKLQSIVRRLPDDAWVLETDAPDQPGAGHQGERNEPAYLVEVADRVATLRDKSVDDIVQQSRINTLALFDLPGE